MGVLPSCASASAPNASESEPMTAEGALKLIPMMPSPVGPRSCACVTSMKAVKKKSVWP